MKTFRTVFPSRRSTVSLTHADRVLLLGSCFTEHIGNRLAAGKFATLTNPNGIVYNPVSIARSLEQLVGMENSAPASESNAAFLFEHAGLWHSWEHHGAFSGVDRNAVLAGIRQAQARAAAFLQQASCLFLTLGTAEVFMLKESGQIVANCHKAPAGWFVQRRLSVSETVAALSAVLQKIKSRHPGITVVLTVSPVRHLRNGFVENQRSKAVLVLACAELCEQLDFVHYFPAYELLLDDLRDYRFYSDDMTHPNEQAIDYIWDFFSDTFFPEETKRLLAQIDKIAAAMRHRPFNPDTPEHRAFAATQLHQVAVLHEKYPDIDFSAEKSHFQQHA